jgi:hypothetical protein
MVLDHLAAIFLFSGPLFYIGLFMALDPAGIPILSQWLRRLITHNTVESGHPEVSPRIRRAVRLTGVALLLVAIVI